MHSIFAPGFPGLLEAFYVQERLIEYLMPDLYKSFVSPKSRTTRTPRFPSGRPRRGGTMQGRSADISNET